MNSEDLEDWGLDLKEAQRWDLLRSVGLLIWWRWNAQILEGKHLRSAELCAFVRWWVAPIGEIPSGLAKYIADRLDPKSTARGRAGREPKSESEVARIVAEEISIAFDVMASWEARKREGARYPLVSAQEAVSTARRLHLSNVRLIFNRRRMVIELLRKIHEGADIQSLSRKELEALAGEETLYSMILCALSEEERGLVASGTSLRDVIFRS